MKHPLVIVDCGMGNLHSVRTSFGRSGFRTVISSDPDVVRAAEKIVLPGVGHFGRAMENLRSAGLIEALNEAALLRRVPTLGICLGMQLFARRSEEGGTAGLGWIDAEVVRFRVDDTLRFKIPHNGWNQVTLRKPDPVVRGLDPLGEFYFMHAYHVVCDDEADTLGETLYSYSFTSALRRDNLWGVQFHPEKSHESGEAMLMRFARL